MDRSFLVILLSAVFASAALAQVSSPTPETNPDKARADRLQGRLTDFPTRAPMLVGLTLIGLALVAYFVEELQQRKSA